MYGFHQMVLHTSAGESESFQHQESEIREEAFYPGIEEVEQDRLEAIVRTRSLLRDAELVVS